MGDTLLALAAAAVEVADLVAQSGLLAAATVPLGNPAAAPFLAAARRAPVAVYAPAEAAAPVQLGAGAALALVIEPLGGLAGLEVNLPPATIFGLLPLPAGDGQGGRALLQPGTALLAAGMVLFGPRTELVLTLLEGTHLFVLDRDAGTFRLARAGLRVPPDAAGYAVDGAGHLWWDMPVRTYVEACEAGADGTGGKEIEMRWLGSLAGEARRVLTRGGIVLAPRDSRPGREHGTVRLVHEAQPLALLIEQAGGAASDGSSRILDLVPASPAQRVPFFFGSCDRVALLRSCHDGALPLAANRSPLFARRGLFRG